MSKQALAEERMKGPSAPHRSIWKTVATGARRSIGHNPTTTAADNPPAAAQEPEMDVQQAIRTKRAIRQFAERPLPAEVVRAILHAGRRAQSSKNTQPWRFVAIQDRETLVALSRMGTYAGHLAGAAFGIAILTPDPSARWSILFDAGQAAAYMQLAAWGLGIGSCLATIYDPEAARALLRFPEGFELHVALSFGYPADPAVASAPPRLGGRRKLSEVIHYERWQPDLT